MSVVVPAARSGCVRCASAGKSTFVNYLLYRLREDYPAADFLLVDHKRKAREQNIYLPGQQTVAAAAVAGASVAARAAALVQQGDESAEFISSVLHSHSSFAIFDQGGDSKAPTGFSCNGIVISSLDSDHFKDFRGVFPLYVVDPAWSREEIEQCYHFMYAEQPKLADYAARFQELGGLPRFVFAYDLNLSEALQLFYSKLPQADGIRSVLQATDACAIHVKDGARMVTFDVDARFKEQRMRWVSDRVGMAAMQRLHAAGEDSAARLLFSISGGDERSAFGCAFEQWAHLLLAKGGTFRVRPVGGGAETQLHLDAADTVWYADGQEGVVKDKVSSLTPPAHASCSCSRLPTLSSSSAPRVLLLCIFDGSQVYGRPNSKQAESIDAIAQPDKLFQMTVSLNKNLKQAGLASTLNGMRSKAAGSVTLYIVVPDTQFNPFQTVTHKGAAGAVPWPAALSQPPMVLSVPMKASAAGAGAKHPRGDGKAAAKAKLQSQAPPVPGGDAVIDELLASAKVTDKDVEMLSEKGLIKWGGRGRAPNWGVIGSFPAAAPQIHVFRRGTTELIYKI
jgi:hypothetical protein